MVSGKPVRKRKGAPLPPPADTTVAMLAQLKVLGTQSVCFFNNKGGVGKTTLVANLAAELSLNLKSKVLVVDADPQCNLTQYAIGDDEFVDIYEDESKLNSVYSIIHPLSVGRGYQKKLPIRSIEKFGFDLIVGDPRLALKEDLLAQDWRDARSGGTRGLRTTFMFHDLISKANNYDFVFFDMGPSLGAINRSILLAVDNFIVPMSIDIFSLWATRNIGTALNAWRKELDVGFSLAEDPTELPFTGKKPLSLVGYVTQQHKERTEGGNIRVVEAYEAIRKKLPKEVVDSLKSFIPSNPRFSAHLGDIRHLGSLAPKSQTLHTPMTMVSMSGSYTSLRKKAREIYREIAEHFLKNLLMSKKQK